MGTFIPILYASNSIWGDNDRSTCNKLLYDDVPNRIKQSFENMFGKQRQIQNRRYQTDDLMDTNQKITKSSTTTEAPTTEETTPEETTTEEIPETTLSLLERQLATCKSTEYIIDTEQLRLKCVSWGYSRKSPYKNLNAKEIPNCKTANISSEDSWKLRCHYWGYTENPEQHKKLCQNVKFSSVKYLRKYCIFHGHSINDLKVEKMCKEDKLPNNYTLIQGCCALNISTKYCEKNKKFWTS